MHLVTLLSVVITLCLMQLVVGARLKMPPALKECIYANIPEEKILPSKAIWGDGVPKSVRTKVWNTAVTSCSHIDGWSSYYLDPAYEILWVALDEKYRPSAAEDDDSYQQIQQISLNNLRELGSQLGKTAFSYISPPREKGYMRQPVGQRALFRGALRPRSL